MIAATVTVTDVSTSIFDLIETATPTQLNEFNTGRVAEVHIQWGGVAAETTIFHLVYKDGTINLATDSGFRFSDPSVNSAQGLMVIRGSAGMNVISLKDIYLIREGGANAPARVTAYTI